MSSSVSSSVRLNNQAGYSSISKELDEALQETGGQQIGPKSIKVVVNGSETIIEQAVHNGEVVEFRFPDLMRFFTLVSEFKYKIKCFFCRDYGPEFFTDDFKTEFKKIINKHNAERKKLQAELKTDLGFINKGRADSLKSVAQVRKTFNETFSCNGTTAIDDIEEDKLKAMARILGYPLELKSESSQGDVYKFKEVKGKDILAKANEISQQEAKEVEDLKAKTTLKAQLLLGKEVAFDGILSFNHGLLSNFKIAEITGLESILGNAYLRVNSVTVEMQNSFKNAYEKEAESFGLQNKNFSEHLVFAEKAAKADKESATKMINQLFDEMEKIQKQIDDLEGRKKIANSEKSGWLQTKLNDMNSNMQDLLKISGNLSEVKDQEIGASIIARAGIFKS